MNFLSRNKDPVNDVNQLNSRLSYVDKTLFYIFCIDLVLFMLIPRYYEMELGGARVNAHRIITIICILWVFFLVRAKNARWQLLDFIYFMLFIWTLLSAVYNGSSLRNYALIIDIYSSCFVFYVMGRSVNKFTFQKITRILSILSILVGLLVVIESAGAFNFYTGLVKGGTGISDIAIQTVIRDGVYRAKGPYEHPLVLSSVLIMIMPYILLEGKGLLKYFSVIASITAIVLTYSRSGFVALPVILASIWFISYLSKMKKDAINASIAIIIVVAVAAYVFEYGSTLALEGSKTESSSTATRIQQYLVGMELLRNSPVFGVGFGNASQSLMSQTVSTVIFYRKTVDSLFLSWAMDTGVPGIIMFVLSIWITLFRVFLYVWRFPMKDWKMRAIVASGASVAGGITCFSTLSIMSSLPFLLFGVGVVMGVTRQPQAAKISLMNIQQGN